MRGVCVVCIYYTSASAKCLQRTAPGNHLIQHAIYVRKVKLRRFEGLAVLEISEQG